MYTPSTYVFDRYGLETAGALDILMVDIVPLCWEIVEFRRKLGKGFQAGMKPRFGF
jgi:hypothetical protein